MPDKRKRKAAEGTDPSNDNSDIWFHTSCMEMMEDDEKTTKDLIKFLKSIGYEMPEPILEGEDGESSQ